MAEGVKATRRYDSPRRREQAAATRREILGAAQRLFEREGYATTTMAAIAREAGVALKTVYVAFETKSGLLRALWHLLLRGAADDAPMGERPWFRELMAEPDPERQVELLAENSVRVKRRAGGILEVIRSAAASDPDAAALWERIQSDFRGIHRPVAERLGERGALRADLDVERATDLLWTLNHPDVWQLLVVRRGWSAEAYGAWFTDAVRAQVLGLPPRAQSRFQPK
jgi:AcrR family transcriptional regulator